MSTQQTETAASPRRAVVLTGAGGGIGSALAAELSRAGWRVVAVDKTPPPAGLDCHGYVRADLAQMLTDEAAGQAAFTAVRREIGGLPLAGLVNNAALQDLDRLEDLTPRRWQAVLDVNLVAPMQWVRELLPELESSRGCVVNMGSIHARQTKPGFSAYAASKAGLAAATRALAVELGGRIRVNAVEPAAIDTPMLRAGFADDSDAYARLAAYHPAGCVGAPSELAALVRFILESPGGFLHGAVIAFDGGISGCLHDPGLAPPAS